MADSELQKAVIKVYRTPVEELTCLFNPADYKISTSTGYSNKKNLQSNKKQEQYIGGFTSTLTLTLYYDITENLGNLSDGVKTKTSVKEYTSKVEALLLEDGTEHKPPQVEFIWGDLTYKGVVTSLNQEFNYFDLDGKPLRAKLDLAISETPGDNIQRVSPKESPDRTKRRMVTEGTTLWRMAWEEYGDCNKWEEIARYNNLMNPLDIRPGQMLRLPALKQ